MATVHILLCCGAGMSSGLVAQKARKAAKKRGLDATIEARSESELQQYLSSIDCLLLGPHYEAFLGEIQEQAKPFGVPVGVIPKNIYATMDGDGLIDYALEVIDKKE